MVSKTILDGRQKNRGIPGTAGLTLPPAHAHKPTRRRASGQGMQHSDSAMLHSGTGSGPDSSDEEILQNCRANCSTVRFKALLKTTARLQAWEVKDGNRKIGEGKGTERRKGLFSFCLGKSKAYQERGDQQGRS